MLRKQPATLPTVTLGDGREATSFVPNLNDKQELAVVSKKVLAFLTALLPKADIRVIIEQFSIQAGTIKTMEEWTTLLQDELDFHLSVNMLQQHLLDKAEPASTVTY